LVEAIDLAPTFTDFMAGRVADEWLEGRSLIPLLSGKPPHEWRDYVISEYDYSMSPMAAKLGVAPKDARLFMVADYSWKLVHCEGGLPPMLFDLKEDPNELNDLGCHPDYHEARQHCYAMLHDWALRCRQRTTLSTREILSNRGKSRRKGIILGLAQASDAEAEILVKYTGKPPNRPK
jgi:arylsulfatase A-like enzyme